MVFSFMLATKRFWAIAGEAQQDNVTTIPDANAAPDVSMLISLSLVFRGGAAAVCRFAVATAGGLSPGTHLSDKALHALDNQQSATLRPLL